MPPKETLTNLRPKDFAIERPIEVFPTPGGPIKHKIVGWLSPPSLFLLSFLIFVKCTYDLLHIFGI